MALHGGQVSRSVVVGGDSVRADEVQQEQNHVRLIMCCGIMKQIAGSWAKRNSRTGVVHKMFYTFQVSFLCCPKQFSLQWTKLVSAPS